MCHSVGLFLQPSQINTQYRKGLNPTLQKVADELYASVADVQVLTQSLRTHIRRNPGIFSQFSTTTTVKPSPITSTPTNPTTSTPSSSTLSTTSKAPIARVEDPVTIKLCREQHICLAWTARKQCRHGDACKYKHAEVVRCVQEAQQITTSTTSTTTLRSPLLDNTEYNVIPDTGCSLSIITWKLAGHLLCNIPDAKVTPAMSEFDTATESQSFSSHFRLHVELPISDGTTDSFFSWHPAIVDNGLLLHSHGLLGMDSLSFEPEGLCLQLNGSKVQISPFLHGIINTSSTPSTTSSITLQDTTPDPSSQQSILNSEVVRPLVSKSNKKEEPYDLSSLSNTTPTFSTIPNGYELAETVFSNEWCTVGILVNGEGQKTFYLDYSNQLLDIVLNTNIKPVRPKHYKLITASDADRRDAEQRLDDLIANKKLIPTPAADKNDLYSNWYPVRGRKRCRPVVPSLRTNSILQQAQKAFPIKDRQIKIDRLLNKFRCFKTAIGYDVKDAYRSIRLGGNAQLLSQIIHNNQHYTYVYMCDGHSTNPPVLELCVQRVIEDVVNDPNFDDDLTSYMDDLQQLINDNPILEKSDVIIKHFKNYSMTLTTEPLDGPESNDKTMLGCQLVDDGSSLLYPDDKYNKAICFDVSQGLTYASALGLLGYITQAWNLLPWHVLVGKNALTALVSRVRAVKNVGWKTPIDDPTLVSLLRRWQQQLQDTPPKPLRKYISTDDPLHVYFDSSETLGAMVAIQNGAVVLRHQWKWSRKERSLHINIKEATTAYYALTVIIDQELDSGKTFTKIVLFGDNKTANAALSTGKASTSGKQSVLLQRVVDLTYLLMGKRHFDILYVPTTHNPADQGTRSDLYNDIIAHRDSIDGLTTNDLDVDRSENNTSTVHVSRVVRKRDHSQDDDDANNKRIRLEKPIQVPRRPQVILPRPNIYDIVQLPPPLLQVYRSIPVQDDGKRLVTDAQFLQACAKHCHEQRHCGAPEIEITPKSLFHAPTINLKDLAIEVARACVTCALTKTTPGDRQYKNPIEDNSDLPSRVWEHASLDILGPFVTDPVTKKPKFYSVNLVDKLSNAIVSLPTISPPTSIDVQRACNLPHRLYNQPLVNITSDNASIITSADHKLPTITFHYVPPRSSAFNGHVERRHKLMNERLRRLFASTPFVDDDTWRDYVAKTCYEINTTRQPAAQGLTPFDMLLETSASPMDPMDIQRPPADKWDKWIKFKHLCRDRVVAAINRNSTNGSPLVIGDTVLQHTIEPHPKATTPWQKTPKTIINMQGNRILLDDGSWTTTDKVKRFTADIGQFGSAYDDQLLVFLSSISSGSGVFARKVM